MLSGYESVSTASGLRINRNIFTSSLSLARKSTDNFSLPIHSNTRCPWKVGSKKVSWCFKPSQPQGITSELRETFMKRYVVERTNKAEIRPEKQSEKTESCRELVS